MELLQGIDLGYIVLLFGVGLTCGFLSGIVGMGGALLLVPALAFVGGIPFKLATGIAALHGLAVGVFAYLVHGRYGAVDGRIGVAAGIASVAGGLIGAAISGWVDAFAVKLIYLAAATLSLILLLVKVGGASARVQRRVPRVYTKAAAFGMFTGVIAGNIGAGGTFMVIPLFRAALKMPIHRAIGTSMLVSIFTAVASTSGKALMGQVPWTQAAIVVTGSALGTMVGARLTRRIPSGPLRWLLIGMLLLLLARTAADLFIG
ncbi:MAG: sulfite exporter TauE/SafE family protein [Chloroflexi bacterium]|nr:sulfite exporter TauE/SafE family protein [Chloroflexota bacterium]